MKTKLPILNTLLLTAILAWLLIGSFNQKNDQTKQAYVVTDELFAGFDYSKELDAEFVEIKNQRTKALDESRSKLMQLEQKIVRGGGGEEAKMEFQMKYGEFQNNEAQTNEDLMTLNQQFGQQIWEKLNAFTKEFGEKNGYEVIFGAGGDGNIMHASEEKNITEELLAFCNQKYNGKK